MIHFDFDKWMNLYNTDPAEFERQRKKAIEDEILAAPIELRGKLRILQMECDVIHNTKGPLEATAELSQMMAQKLSELKAPLAQLRGICKDL